MKPTRNDFERLAMEQLDTLYRVARRLTRRSADAEDLVQETLLRAFSAADRFRLQEYGIKPWLLRIMHNLYLTRGGREARQPRMLDEQTWASLAKEDGAAAWSGQAMPADLFDSLDEQLAGALERLPQEYQQVMLLWAVEELSYQEIATVLNIPLGTVMSRLHRSRQRLAMQLADYAKSEGRVVRE